ncbi:MAG: SbcC/MukB-like Walker B domain-containing protein [Oxalobacteraceae bacterium]
MKLDKLILVNWGALRSQEYPMGNMTLLTGPTGSGKSTMIDALQTVMTAVYQNIFNYNPGQDETTQGARNGKTKRTLWSYIVGAEDNLFARPDGAHGYIAAVFKPSEGEEGREFTALVAAAARVDGAGERRHAVVERLALLLIDGVALQLGDLTSSAIDNSMDVVAVENIEQHLSAKYSNVTNFRDSKREYLCQLYGRFRGQKTVSFIEAEGAAKAWSQSIAHKPIGSVDELVKHQILELDTSQLAQRIAQISKLMRQVNALRKEGERLSDNVERLEQLGQAVSATAGAHQLACQSQLLVASMALREDQRQLEAAAVANATLQAQIAEEDGHAEKLEQDCQAKNRSLMQIHVQMAGIPAAEQKARIQNQIAQCEARIKAVFNTLQQHAQSARQLENAARNVAGMQIPPQQKEIADAARQVVQALAAAAALDLAARLASIAALARADEVDVLQALLLVSDFSGVDAALEKLHVTLAGTESSFVSALHTQIAQLRASEQEALRREKDAAARKANLAEGGADYPIYVLHALKEFRSALAAARAQVLCDLVEPMSADWQAAIEGYMGGARFNLVVDQEWEEKAIEFVHQHKLRAKVIQGSLCLENLKIERTPSDSIVHELGTEHPIACAYLHEQFGQVVKVADAEALRRTSRGLTRDGKCSGSRTMFGADADSLVFGREAKRLARQRAEQDHAQAERELTEIRTQLRELQGALELMGRLHCPSFAAIGELECLVRELDAARQDLGRLDLTQVGKLEQEAQALSLEIATMGACQTACNKRIGGHETAMQGHQAAIARLNLGLSAKQARVDADTGQLRALCIVNGSLSFTALTYEVASWVGDNSYTQSQASGNAARQTALSWQLYADARTALGEYHAHARSDERFEVVQGDDLRESDFTPLYAQMVALQTRIRAQLMRQKDIGLIKNLEQLRTAESSFNDVFTKQFCYEIRNNVDTGVRTLKTLNVELDKLKFGTDKFRIDWSEWVPEFKAYYDFFCATSEMSEIADMQGSGSLFDGPDLSPENCQVRDQLVQLLLSEDEDKALKELQRVADYRNYRRYEIYKESDTGSHVRLSEWGTGSGGQLETPAYIIHAAVVTNRLKRFEKGSSLRLLVNDESFAKMDEGRARDVLQFLREHLGMQLICAMPTKHAGAIKPEFSREWSFSRTVADGNGEVGFVSEADQRELHSDQLRALWETRRLQVREQAQIHFEAAEQADA